MLFGHHEFDDPTIQGNSFYIKIVYSPDSVDGFGSNTWFFIGGRKDALTVRCDDLEAWLGHGGKFGSEWWDSPIVSGGDLGDFYGFFMGIYDEFLHEKCWWIWVAVLLNPCWQRCFFLVHPAGMIAVNVKTVIDPEPTILLLVSFPFPLKIDDLKWSKRWFSIKSHHFDPFSGFTVPLLWLILTCYSSNILLVLHIFSDFTEGSHSKLGISVIADTSDTVGHMGYNPANITGICQRGHKGIEITYVF